MADRQLYGIGFVFGAEWDSSIERSANAAKDAIDSVVRSSGTLGAESSKDVDRFSSVAGRMGSVVQDNLRGIQREERKTTQETGRLSTMFSGLFSGASAGSDRLRRGLEAINAINLDAIRDRIEGLTSQVAGGLDVSSTSMESFGAEFGQTYRQMTAGLGEYRGEVDAVRGEISGLSFSLGVGAEGMLTYATNIARAGYAIDDFGLSMRAVAGLEQAGIIQGAELSALLTDLANSYDLGAAGATGLLDRIVAVGEQFGFGADAIRQMPEAMQAIGPIASTLGWTGEQASQAAESIMRLAMANTSLGGAPQDAFESAVATFSQLGESRRSMEQLLSGMQGDFPQLATDLGVAVGDIGQAFDALMLDPVRFAQSVRRMYQESSDPAQQQRLRIVMADLGSQFGWLAQGSDEVGAALDRAVGPVENVTGAMNRLGTSAAGSARTFSEAMENARERFQGQLNTMVRGMPGYENFERRVLRRQRRAFDALSDRMERFVGGDGLFAALGRTALAARRGGVGGLAIAIEQELGTAFPALAKHIDGTLPLLGEFADAAFETASDAIPLIAALGSMGMRIPNLTSVLGFMLNPLTLIAAGIVYLAVRGDEAAGDLERLETELTRITGRLVGFSKSFSEMARGVDWEAIGQDVVSGILGLFGAVDGEQSQLSQNITEIFRNIFDGASQAIGGLARGMWGRIVEYIMEPGDLETRIQRGGSVAGVAAGGAMATAFFSPFRATLFRGAGRLIGRVALRSIPGIGAVIGMLLDLPQIIGAFRTDGISGGMQELLSSALDGFLLGIPSIIQRFTGFDLVGTIVEGFLDFSGMGRVLGLIDEGDWFGAIAEGLFNALNGLFAGIPNIIRGAIERATGEDIFGGLTSAIATGLEQIVDLSRGVFDWFMTDAVPVLRQLGGVAMDVFGRIGDHFRRLWEVVLRPVIVGLWEWYSGLFRRIQIVATDVFGGVAGLFQTWWGYIQSGGEYFRGLASVISWWWNNITLPVFDAFSAVFWWLMENTVGRAISSWRTMGAIIGWWWDNITYPILRLYGRIYAGILRAIWFVTSSVFRAIAAIVGWWWDNITHPVLMALWGAWQWLWGNVSGIAIETWRGIGEIVTWVQTEYLDPAFAWIGETWDRISSWVSETAETVWRAVSGFITDRIDGIVAGILFLQQSWRGVVNLMQTGLRLIGAVIAAHLIGPLTRAARAVLELVAPLLRGTHAILAAIGQTSLATTVDQAAESIYNMLGQMTDEDIARREREQWENVRRLVGSWQTLSGQLTREAQGALGQVQAARLAEEGASERGVSPPAEGVTERVARGPGARGARPRGRGARRPARGPIRPSLPGSPAVPTAGVAAPPSSPGGAAPLGAPGGAAPPGAPGGARGRGDRGGAHVTARRVGAAEGAEEAQAQAQARETARAMEISGFGGRAEEQLRRALRVQIVTGSGRSATDY